MSLYLLSKEPLGLYWGSIGIVENEMETSALYWGYIGIMEEKMYRGYTRVILRICNGLWTGPNSDPPGTQVSVAFEGLGKIVVRLLRADFGRLCRLYPRI